MSIVSSITGVWDSILTWIIGSINDAQALFFDAQNGLTFLGVLSVITVAVGIVFLVIGVIQNFLHLRG